MRKRLLLALVFLLSGSVCLGWEWQPVHEKESAMTVAEADQALLQGSGQEEARYLAALVCLRRHDDARAFALFGSMLKDDPGSLPAQWGRAEVLRRQHKLSESRAIVDHVIKKAPDFYPAYITRAYISYLQGNFKETAAIAQKVIADKERADAQTYVRALVVLAGARGLIAHYAGPVAKLVTGTRVLPMLKKAQKLAPGSAVVMLGLGGYYLLAPALAGGDLALAKEYLNKAIEADPLLADAYVRLAQAYKASGDEKKYAGMLKRALDIDPGNELAKDVASGTCLFVCR